MDRREGTASAGGFQTSQAESPLSLWQLPQQVELDGEVYPVCSDYRDILEIFSYWDDPDLPEFAKWQIALALFYERPVPQHLAKEAMAFLASFIEGGQSSRTGGTRLLDWQQDAPLIVADVNKVAGCEIRALPYVHWWTFLSWFHGIGQGQLSAVVSIREKLAKGKKLDSWEAEFYREHKNLVKLETRLSSEERLQRARLQSLLSEGREVNGV